MARGARSCFNQTRWVQSYAWPWPFSGHTSQWDPVLSLAWYAGHVVRGTHFSLWPSGLGMRLVLSCTLGDFVWHLGYPFITRYGLPTVCSCMQYSTLTSLQIPGSDTAVLGSVVCDHIHGGYILVIECVAMVINEGAPSQHAEVSSGSCTNPTSYLGLYMVRLASDHHGNWKSWKCRKGWCIVKRFVKQILQ